MNKKYNISMEEIASKLKEERIKKGWSQVTLAKNAGLSVRWVIHQEKKERLSVNALTKMADALGFILKTDFYLIKKNNSGTI